MSPGVPRISGTQLNTASTPNHFEPLTGILHLHTVDDDGRKRISLWTMEDQNAGAQFVAQANHNVFSNGLGVLLSFRVGKPTVMPGSETWVNIAGGRGDYHVGVVNVSAEQAIVFGIKKDMEPPELAAAVTRAKGAIVLHHPEYTYSGARMPYPPLLPAEAAAFHGIEIVNGRTTTDDSIFERNLAWVQEQCWARGSLVSIVSGSDKHPSDPANPRPAYTVALSKGGKASADFAEAIRAGRTYITYDKGLEVTGFTLDNKTNLGEHASVAPGSKHSLRVQLRGLPPGATVQVFRNGQSIYSAARTNGVLDTSLDFLAEAATPNGRSGYVYLRVFDAQGKPLLVSSALGLDLTGQR